MQETDSHEVSDQRGGYISFEKGYLSSFSHQKKKTNSQHHHQDFLQGGTDYPYVKWQDI